MARVYTAAGYFLISASFSGIPSYLSYSYPALRWWAFWLGATVFCLLLVGALLDDFLVDYFEISRRTYWGCILGFAISAILGGIIQWQG